jgi:hypothetical protein
MAYNTLALGITPSAKQASGQQKRWPIMKNNQTEPQTISIGINLVSSRKCLARCYNAKGGSCNCVCGGVNHGIERPIEAPLQQSIFDAALTGPRSLTKDEFYRNEDRKRSRELDYGVWWRDGRNYPTYRVTWVANTGEVYAIDQQEIRIELLGKVPTESEVERLLDGWSGICGLMNSLQWVREQVG